MRLISRAIPMYLTRSKRSPPLPLENSVDSSEHPSRQIDQPMPNRVHNQLRRFVYTKSVHHIGAMDGDGVRAKLKRGGNLLIRLTLNNHLQNFKFARSEASVPRSFECCGAFELRIKYGFAVRNSPDSRDEF